MARSAEPGRTALLGAGRRLLDDVEGPVLNRVSVNAVVAEAGMSKGAFYQHWPDRDSYVLALHRQLHDSLAALVAAALAGRPPGSDRLSAGMGVYLDGCLDERATKALLAQARHEPSLVREVATRDAFFAAAALPDITALGWSPAEPAAVLFVAMVAATALAESAAGGPRVDLRHAVLAYLIGKEDHL